jgi:hypothetical protein
MIGFMSRPHFLEEKASGTSLRANMGAVERSKIPAMFRIKLIFPGSHYLVSILAKWRVL